MKLTHRAKLALIAMFFALPIAASVVTYVFFPPAPTGNYGELLLPPASAPAELIAMRERWILVAWDRARCAAACEDKITVMRQVRLALGRNASRVDRVLLLERADGRDGPGARWAKAFTGSKVACRKLPVCGIEAVMPPRSVCGASASGVAAFLPTAA